MDISIIEAVMDNYRRLSRAVEEIARQHVEREKSDRDYEVFKTNAHMESFYVEEDSTITVYFDYSHPYEGDETISFDASEIEHF